MAGDPKKTKKKLTWLADTPDLVDIEIVELDFLLNKDKVEEDDDIKVLTSHKSRWSFAAKGEAAMRQMNKAEVVQVERRGYYICDTPYVRPSEKMVLLFIPDGKKLFGVEPPELKKPGK